MSAEIVRLPVAFRPRVIENPARCAFQAREIAAAEGAMSNVVDAVLRFCQQPDHPEAILTEAVHAAEETLFHLIMATGAPEADRDLVNLLASRRNRREP